MKPLKDKSLVTPEYVDNLRRYIIRNQETFFKKENEADAWRDFELFNQPTDRMHLCIPGEVMLIDRDHDGVHTYCICAFGPKNRVTLEIPVIAVDELNRNYWRNGYFLLPVL